jgi:hypothetical protein
LPSGVAGSGAALGKLEQVTASIKNFTAPIWRAFSRKPRFITINSSIMRIAPRGVMLAELGPPVSTNANGARAWVVGRGKLQAFFPPLDAIRDNYAVMMVDGGRSGMSSGAFIIIGGTNEFKTFRMSYASKIISEGVRLDVVVTLNSSVGGTDLASIRARIPTAGALLVDCPISRASDGRHYLFVFTPTIPPPATLTSSPNVFRPAHAYTTTPPHSQW